MSISFARPVGGVPGIFVIDCSGYIASAHVDADYRNRPEPQEIVAYVGHYGANQYRIDVRTG